MVLIRHTYANVKSTGFKHIQLSHTATSISVYAFFLVTRVKWFLDNFLDDTGERTLDDILRHHRLPCEVGFPKERDIVMGERTINTTNLPNLTLTVTFDELHFLGFSICDGMTYCLA